MIEFSIDCILTDSVFYSKSFHVCMGRFGLRYGSYLNVRIFTIDDELIIEFLLSTT